MKTPTNYGSDNEETRFIRRVAAPDRPNSKRRQKKRLAVAGAALGLLAASAGIGYAVTQSSSTVTSKTVETQQLEADSAFVSKLGDSFHADFEAVDQDNDGTATTDEILAQLERVEEADVEKVKSSNLSEEIKQNLISLLEEKLKSDRECATNASQERQFPVTKEDAEMFYYLLDVFCPRVTIAVTPPEQADYGKISGSPADEQTVTIQTPDGGEKQVVVDGEPVNGQQTIEIPNDEGGYTTTEVKAEETPSGEEKLEIPNGEGGATQVVVPEAPAEETTTESEQTQVVDVVAPNGDEQQVVVEGEPENGEQTIAVPNDEGGYTEQQVDVEETPSGDEQIVVPDGQGGVQEVTVPDVPDVATETSEDTQVVNVVAPSGDQQQIVIVGEPDHGEQTVEIPNDEGDYTEKEVKVEETPEGDQQISIPDGEGGVQQVTIPDTPAEISQETVPETAGKFMTKDEFREWIRKHYEDKLDELKKSEEELEEEAKERAHRVSNLEDCIVQAANKFGYYGVYEQPPHYQNAVDWVENDCWKTAEAESNPIHFVPARQLRRV